MPRLKVSDRLFNASCLVTAKTKRAAQSALEDDSLQSALKDRIGDGGVLKIRDAWLLYNCRGRRPTEGADLVSTVAVTAHHLEERHGAKLGHKTRCRGHIEGLTRCSKACQAGRSRTLSGGVGDRHCERHRGASQTARRPRQTPILKPSDRVRVE